MTDSAWSISVDLTDLMPPEAHFTEAMFPHLAAAVEGLARTARATWVSYAEGAPMPNGMTIKSRSGEYARSIQLQRKGPFAWEVFTTLPYADAIENGSPARDLTKMLNSSAKVRMSAKGKRYLIIPFRWNTPGAVSGQAMPKNVFNWWRDQQRSVITGTYRRVSGQPDYFDIKTRERVTVPGWRYRWGSRLGAADLEALGRAGKQATRMLGMVAFRDPDATSGSKSGKYLTFRVMVEGSSGWKVPAQPGKFPGKQVSDQAGAVAKDVFREAMKADVAAILTVPE